MCVCVNIYTHTHIKYFGGNRDGEQRMHWGILVNFYMCCAPCEWLGHLEQAVYSFFDWKNCDEVNRETGGHKTSARSVG